jgi:hypothetical protein
MTTAEIVGVTLGASTLAGAVLASGVALVSRWTRQEVTLESLRTEIRSQHEEASTARARVERKVDATNRDVNRIALNLHARIRAVESHLSIEPGSDPPAAGSPNGNGH